MAGERLESARLGWHGIEGDRRLALRRMQVQNGFPWLTGTKLPDLLQFTPVRRGETTDGDLPTHVCAPDGREMAVFGEELAAEIESLHNSPVEMMHLREGIFDQASVSVISVDTIAEIGAKAGKELDVRRFRPNILVSLTRPGAFQEESWIGGILLFGDPEAGPRVNVALGDERCAMVNYDPDSGSSSSEVLKTIVQTNANIAGIYGTVVRTGRIAVGQKVHLQR